MGYWVGSECLQLGLWGELRQGGWGHVGRGRVGWGFGGLRQGDGAGVWCCVGWSDGPHAALLDFASVNC